MRDVRGRAVAGRAELVEDELGSLNREGRVDGNGVLAEGSDGTAGVGGGDGEVVGEAVCEVVSRVRRVRRGK
jgi:hypothetical protein